MELYVTDKKDKENAVYMLEWFKKEMDARDYIYDDFIEWAASQRATVFQTHLLVYKK